jgi:PBP1b-binding outer membrane lipoprotein LpoB
MVKRLCILFCLILLVNGCSKYSNADCELYYSSGKEPWTTKMNEQNLETEREFYNNLEIDLLNFKDESFREIIKKSIDLYKEYDSSFGTDDQFTIGKQIKAFCNK